MKNESEYLVISGYGPDKLAILLDANLNRIAEYNAGSDEVEQLLDGAKTLGALSGNDREKVMSGLDPEVREHAVAYRLPE